MEELKNKFLAVETRKDLADVLGVPLGTLNYYCTLKQSSSCYHQFIIKKKNGGERLILAPNKQLKYIQCRLSKILYEIYEPKRIAHGFILGRNIVSNAKVHIGHRYILNIDVENFFTFIHFGRVRGMFAGEPFCFNETVSLALAQLVCYRGCLPQGAPTSPIISNFICRSLDNDLIKIGKKYKCVCTRYCDDITISSKSQYFPTGIAFKNNDEVKIGAELLAIFNKHNFAINGEKTRLQSNQSRKMVTGLVVNVKLNILNWKYRKFRAILHYTYWHGPEEGAKRNLYVNEKGEANVLKFRRFLEGTINYYKMILTENSSKYQCLAKKFNEIFEERFPIPKSFSDLVQQNVFVIERIDLSQQGTAFLVKGVGLVTCLHTICNISEQVCETELSKIIDEKVKVYRPSNQNHTFSITLKRWLWVEDLLILNIAGVSFENAYELANVHERPVIGQESYTAIGYANFAPGRTIDFLREIKVRSIKREFGQELFIIDRQFLTGSSGGPVFNQEEKVIGYIDRGDESTEETKHESAFCLLAPLLVLN